MKNWNIILKRESKAFADGNQVFARKKCRPSKE
jgi:hypothetical protein